MPRASAIHRGTGRSSWYHQLADARVPDPRRQVETAILHDPVQSLYPHLRPVVKHLCRRLDTPPIGAKCCGRVIRDPEKKLAIRGSIEKMAWRIAEYVIDLTRIVRKPTLVVHQQ